MHNFFILHKSGECVYARSFGGATSLDQSLITGFFSSVSTFTQALAREELREITLEHARFVYREINQFVFVAHCAIEDAVAVVNNQLADVQHLCQLFFGPASLWSDGFLQLDGFDDVIDAMFRRISEEPAALVRGYQQVFIDQEHRDRLDGMLASLEDGELVSGMSTMLVLGNSVLHTRLPLIETRLILMYLHARPLGEMALRQSPVHTQNAWHNLQLIQLQAGVLVLMTSAKAAFRHAAGMVRAFESNLVGSSLNLPAEEPPVLMRHFATRDTVTFVFHNIRSGVVVSPELRAGSPEEKKQHRRAFWWFFGEASKLLSEAGLTELSMAKDGYRFHARLDGIQEMYVLYSDQVRGDAMEKLSAEVSRKVALRYS